MPFAYIVPRRADLAGQPLPPIIDLWPINSQMLPPYQPGYGQSFYIGEGCDILGTSKFTGNSWAGGSRNTAIQASDDAVAAATVTTGSNNVLATPTPGFGLAFYLRERVQPGGLVSPTAGRMTPANAESLAQQLMVTIAAGGLLTLANINSILSNVAYGGTAATELTGAGGSYSFGAVSDVVQIAAGFLYQSPMNIIICNSSNNFLGLAARNALVPGTQSTNGGITFLSEGYFADDTSPGYRAIPTLTETGAFNLSNAVGQISSWKVAVAFQNPNYAYSAALVDQFHPRATNVDGSTIAAGGSAPVIAVYDAFGNAL